jgi:hypothetical protein
MAHLAIVVGAGYFAEGLRIIETPDGSESHARILILLGECKHRLALFIPKFL